MPQDNSQAGPSNAPLAPRLMAGETRHALISGEEFPARWLGKKSTKSMPAATIEALMKYVSHF